MRNSILVLTVLSLAAFGCSKKDNSESKKSDNDTTEKGKSFTKKKALNILRKTYHAIIKSKWEDLKKYFNIPKGRTFEGLKKHAPRFIEKKELSLEGIDVLGEKGEFDTLTNLFKRRAKQWAKKNGIDNPDNCYGLKYERAKAIFCKYSDGWKIIRMDDIGKIK